MSYDIRLIDPVTREAIEAEAPHLMQGGTYVQGGTTELFRFNEAAVHDYLSFKNAMESMSQGISKAIESRIKKAEKVVK